MLDLIVGYRIPYQRTTYSVTPLCHAWRTIRSTRTASLPHSRPYLHLPRLSILQFFFPDHSHLILLFLCLFSVLTSLNYILQSLPSLSWVSWFHSVGSVGVLSFTCVFSGLEAWDTRSFDTVFAIPSSSYNRCMRRISTIRNSSTVLGKESNFVSSSFLCYPSVSVIDPSEHNLLTWK